MIIINLKTKLENYSKQGETTKFKNTYNEIKDFLENSINKELYDFEIYLQGSYVNNTNIQDDSDVDIVIELKSIFSYDIENLNEDERKEFYSKFSNATIKLEEFQKHIKSLLDKSKYHYKEKSKCLKIVSGTSLNADLIICNSFRKYTKYPDFNKGIYLKDNTKSIKSFPKIHKENMETKNAHAKLFKPTVRIFKNFKIELINNHYFPKNDISSYFVESLLFNVPENLFQEKNDEKRVLDICNYLLDKNTDLKTFLTPCGQKKLFGLTENQWTSNNAKKFISYIKYFIMENSNA